MKKHYSLFFLIFLASQAIAQQASQFTQSADEFGLNNPAGLSFEEMRYKCASLNINIRNQWWKNTAGFPRTQALSWLDARPERFQYGLAFISDKIGETRTLGLQARYAHGLSKHLKLGLSMTGYSSQINVVNLDQYDAGDPIAAIAGETQWRLAVGSGVYYYLIERRRRTWSWYAGAAFRHLFPLRKLPGGGDAPTETDLFAQGGIGYRDSWMTGGRLRLSYSHPGSLDAYVRKYFIGGNYFVGGIFTSDMKHQTAGVQVGIERQIRSSGKGDNYYLAVSMSFSKSLSNYIEGNNLIFDMRATWILEQGRE